MTEKANQPRKYDAVLGGKNSLPVNTAVLGGIEGVKRRLTAADELVRVGAVRDALKYGEAGLDLAIASLDDESAQVRQTVLNLLQEKLALPKVRALIGLVNDRPIRIYREEFETVTINELGEIIKREPRQTEFFVEDLGGPSARQEQRQRSCPRLAPRNGVELEMVSIPGGSFLMGSPLREGYNDETPQHRVNVPPFFLGKHPVTQKQYEAVMGKNPSGFTGPNLPVEQVSWNDAAEFCRRLSQKTGKQYRLPSEAQWEYACRAGTTTPFSFGETITTDLVNYDNSDLETFRRNRTSGGRTMDVGSFPPNAFGLYDLHGNVWEWCQDVWHENYNGAPTDGSAWESGGDGSMRILRGGSWYRNLRHCRSALRLRLDARYWSDSRGFRVAL